MREEDGEEVGPTPTPPIRTVESIPVSRVGFIFALFAGALLVLGVVGVWFADGALGLVVLTNLMSVVNACKNLSFSSDVCDAKVNVNCVPTIWKQRFDEMVEAAS